MKKLIGIIKKDLTNFGDFNVNQRHSEIYLCLEIWNNINNKEHKGHGAFNNVDAMLDVAV